MQPGKPLNFSFIQEYLSYIHLVTNALGKVKKELPSKLLHIPLKEKKRSVNVSTFQKQACNFSILYLGSHVSGSEAHILPRGFSSIYMPLK